MKPTSFLTLLLPLLLLLAGCGDCHNRRVRGAGPIVTETRTVISFTRIDASQPTHVYLTQGPLADIRIEAQRNVLDVLRTEVVSNELRIGADNSNLDIKDPIRVYITTPELAQLSGSGTTHFFTQGPWTVADLIVRLSGAGGGDLDVAGTGTLRTDLSGASELTLRGTFPTHRTTLSGASKLWAFNQTVAVAEIDASGASRAEVAVDNTLSVRASGASKVYYRGSPTVSSDVSGGSQIVKTN